MSRLRPFFYTDTEWKMWGLGISASFGDCDHWSISLDIGPFMVTVGLRKILPPLDLGPFTVNWSAQKMTFQTEEKAS